MLGPVSGFQLTREAFGRTFFLESVPKGSEAALVGWVQPTEYQGFALVGFPTTLDRQTGLLGQTLTHPAPHGIRDLVAVHSLRRDSEHHSRWPCSLWKARELIRRGLGHAAVIDHRLDVFGQCEKGFDPGDGRIADPKLFGEGLRDWTLRAP